ncbi:hypothetical protein ACLQ2P_13105 [Actinomadura citrea]|uniref:hypothetical protein n=1 Tax=Actinomadura citrea TaxID=46158 RepID=UPI003CE545BF
MLIGVEITIRVADELLMFLPATRRESPARVPYDGTSTLGHLVESLGVPLPEAGPMTADGEPAGPATRPEAGAEVRVAAVPRPQPRPHRGERRCAARVRRQGRCRLRYGGGGDLDVLATETARVHREYAAGTITAAASHVPASIGPRSPSAAGVLVNRLLGRTHLCRRLRSRSVSCRQQRPWR